MVTAPDASALHVQRFTVPFEYPVVFTRDLFAPGNSTLAWAVGRHEPQREHRCLVVADAGVCACWPDLDARVQAYAAAHPALVLAGAVREVPGGEASKADPQTVERVLQWVADERIDRHAYVVAVGGGAVLDTVGYAAALAHRGVRLIRVPTTVLAQNDAGVGVKNGINGFGGKNFLGTFVPPHAVLNDANWIATLSPRDRVAGIAEAVKVGLIRDGAFFDWIEANAAELHAGGEAVTATMIRRCAELHLQHIATSGDPFERGSARPLDYGHWSAHKLELLSAHALRHGEAVAIGMLLDAQYAALSGDLDVADVQRLASVLDTLGLPRWHAALEQRGTDGRAVLDGLEEFREHLGGQLTVTLLRGLGTALEVHEIDRARMDAAIDALRDAAA
ncbi:MAG: 3-dehydroquinate synthase [Myxococcota bacterium]